MTSWMHEERLNAAFAVVERSGARSVLDLGCGDGDLFVRLAHAPAVTRLVGVDICATSLARLRHRLSVIPASAARIELRNGSMTQAHPALSGFDCAMLIETIEHIDPSQLTQLECAVFGKMQPRSVVITTPNAEFNTLLGVPAHRFRHPGHRFEWRRAQFRKWGDRVGTSFGYDVMYSDIAGCHPDLGGASQMAVFEQVQPRCVSE